MANYPPLVWEDEQTPILPHGIVRLTRNQVAAAYGEGFVIEDDDGAPLPEEDQIARAVHDRDLIRRNRPILFAEMYGAGPATLNRIVHDGDHFDLEAMAQHPATAEVNRNEQS